MRYRISTIRNGFTLIEMMVVIAIVAILMMIAVPSFRSFSTRYALTTTSNDFLGSITQTRNEAIRRARRIDMVPANNGTNWAAGWVIFADTNNNQLVDAGEEVIFQHPAIPTTVTIGEGTGASCTTPSAALPFNSGTASFISYLGTGYPDNTTITGSRGIIFTDTNTATNRHLCINFIGRPRIDGN